LLFRYRADGGPRALDWAEATGTIHYEIVSRIGPRVPRRYVGLDGEPAVRRRTGIIGGALGVVAARRDRGLSS